MPTPIPQHLSTFLKVLWRVNIGEQLAAFGDPELDGLSPVHNGTGGDLPYPAVCSFCHVLELDALVVATRGGAMALMHVGEGEEQPRLEQVRGTRIHRTALYCTVLRAWFLWASMKASWRYVTRTVWSGHLQPYLVTHSTGGVPCPQLLAAHPCLRASPRAGV